MKYGPKILLAPISDLIYFHCTKMSHNNVGSLCYGILHNYFCKLRSGLALAALINSLLCDLCLFHLPC